MTAYNPLMADWLIPLLRIGGFGAVLVLALFVMGRWLLGQITVALNSYLTAYAAETARIDARIERLEKVAEEQAHLTRTVESVKDEIAAQAKSRDNRWAFRKDVYVNLIKLLSEFLFLRLEYMSLLKTQRTIDHCDLAQLKTVEDEKAVNLDRSNVAYKEYMTHVRIAQLAMADNALLAQLLAQRRATGTPASAANDEEKQITQEVEVLSDLLGQLARGGRKDLWGTPGTEAKAEAAVG